MNTFPTTPTLTPTFCFNTRFVLDFLRLSRAQIDDSISTNLNALLTPAERGFDPSSTASNSTRQVRRPIPASTCAHFTSQILFPSWSARGAVLSYCAAVASSSDPDDPDAVAREAQERADNEKRVDERLDPYSGRRYPYLRESRTEKLARLVSNEEAVERIVRERSWGVLRERCAGGGEQEWWRAGGRRRWISGGKGMDKMEEIKLMRL